MQDRISTPSRASESTAYEPPEFDVIPLDCEITSYAPMDEDQPLL